MAFCIRIIRGEHPQWIVVYTIYYDTYMGFLSSFHHVGRRFCEAAPMYGPNIVKTRSIPLGLVNCPSAGCRPLDAWLA